MTRRVVAAHHLIGEIQAAGPGVHHRHVRRELALLQAPGHLAAEAVISEPRVADAGDQDRPQPARSHS